MNLSPVAPVRSPKAAEHPGSHQRAVYVVLVLFFTWGFLTALNDVLVTAFRNFFGLTYGRATLVEFVYYLACFFFSFVASRIIVLANYRPAMVLGLSIMAIASALLAAASQRSSFLAFLLALGVMAAGSTQLQTAAGPYISLLGDERYAASRFSLALGINSLGAMLAPPFGAWLFLNPLHRNDTTRSLTLRGPYLCIALSLAALAVVVYFAHLPPILESADRMTHGRYHELLRLHPFVLFGVLAMTLYVGAEISIGSLLLNYLTLWPGPAVSYKLAGFLASTYGMGAMIGRFIGAHTLLRQRPALILVFVATAASLLIGASQATQGLTSAGCLLAIGFCNSVMVPIIFTTTIAGLGSLTSAASGLLVAALVGGAVLPILQGKVADAIGLQHSFVLPGLCYLFVLAYGLAVMRRELRPH